MGGALREGVRILRQRRLPGGGAGRAARYTSQHDEAFGHQVGVGLKGRGHGGEEGVQGAKVVALDIPASLFDLGAYIDGAD